MSKGVSIVAVAHPAPGKLERFKEVVAVAIEWIRDNEPGTLQFEVYEETGKDAEDVKISMFERYASQEALDAHEQSDSYKKFFESVMAEELLAGVPQITRGTYACGFRR
ncbi:hypothetical protein LTR56_010142 [Elasticomyces elasticus]|nr:hypothetical protein LTR56_010142 [Elasticomyces elasticus]KAK3658866.1 hypothetical protein LTR22_008691 [Elasticomyces elasticus]KAK4923008.1 hypothetical protein LTR49_009670 [Elasticomyces elasticus]KAK5758098.1 hypothetical protein LTS12_011858 [Elasticomyces elasticus]